MKTTTQILESALAAGTTKAALPWRRTLALALLAGAFIALGGLLSIIAGAAAEAPAAKRLLSGAVFPIGLILIVTLGGELFTGNNAVLIPALAANRTSLTRVLSNWTLVWLGNFAGALAFVGKVAADAGDHLHGKYLLHEKTSFPCGINVIIQEKPPKEKQAISQKRKRLLA